MNQSTLLRDLHVNDTFQFPSGRKEYQIVEITPSHIFYTFVGGLKRFSVNMSSKAANGNVWFLSRRFNRKNLRTNNISIKETLASLPEPTLEELQRELEVMRNKYKSK